MGSGGLSLQESLRRAAASFSLPSSPSTSEVPPPSPAPASVSGANDVDDDAVDGKEERETGEVEEEAAAKVRVGPAEALADAVGTQGESSSSEGYLSWDDSVLPSWAEDLWGTPGFGRSPGSMTTEDDAVTQVTTTTTTTTTTMIMTDDHHVTMMTTTMATFDDGDDHDDDDDDDDDL